MDLNWFEGILYGMFTGLAEILPVSAHAHKLLLLKIFGASAEPTLMGLMIHLGVLAALYYGCQNHIIRILRAKRLSRIPKRRRKRPLDTKSLKDFSLLKFMVVPVIIAFCFYRKLEPIRNRMIWMAVFVMVNGFVLYLPQFFHGGNKDSSNMTRLDALLSGLGGAVDILPGMSGVAGATSVASVCGVDRMYALNLTLLMTMGTMVGYGVHDVLTLVSAEISESFGSIMVYILAGAAAFGGATLGIRVLRALVEEIGFSVFAYYCWGLSLFTVVINLLA